VPIWGGTDSAGRAYPTRKPYISPEKIWDLRATAAIKN